MTQSGASNLDIIVGGYDGSVHFHRLQAVDRFVSRSTARTFLYRFILPGLGKRSNVIQSPGDFFVPEFMI
jgi:hypothetical protein